MPPPFFAVALIAALALAARRSGGLESTEPGDAARAYPSVKRFLDRILPEGPAAA